MEATHEPVEVKRATAATAAVAAPRPVCRFATSDHIFHAGDPRQQLLRVESGAVCHYMLWPDGRHEVIEFAFPGDVIGFGNLATHVSTAQALLETTVSQVSPEEFEAALEHDGQLAARLAAASDREFKAVRERSIAGLATNFVQRLAAYLVAVAHIEQRQDEGKPVIEDVSCPVVADRLEIEAAQVETAIGRLEADGLVTTVGGGLRLDDLAGLEALASGTRRAHVV